MKPWTAAIATLLLLLAGAGFWRFRGSSGETGRVPVADRRDDARRAPIVPPATGSSSIPERAIDTAPPPRSAPATVTMASSGRLRANVVDATTSMTFASVTTRALSRDRFGETRGQGGVEMLLTPGAYDVEFAVRGFEPELRREVVIAAGGATDLGTIVLGRGTARISGQLSSRGLPDGALRYVELRGEGRSPCPRCAERRDPAGAAPVPLDGPIHESKCCGYASERSVWRVADDGRYTFGGLAAGVYFLRPLDGQLRAQPTIRLELARGENRLVDLTLEREVSLRLALRDASDAPFVGTWCGDANESPAPIRIIVDVDGVLLGAEAFPDVDEVCRAIGPAPRVGRGADPAATNPARLPPPADLSFERDPVPIAGDFPCDRPREPGDELHPTPAVPAFLGARVELVREAPDAYVVLHLPASRVRVSASSGPLTAPTLELDLADPSARSAQLRFAR